MSSIACVFVNIHYTTRLSLSLSPSSRDEQAADASFHELNPEGKIPLLLITDVETRAATTMNLEDVSSRTASSTDLRRTPVALAESAVILEYVTSPIAHHTQSAGLPTVQMCHDKRTTPTRYLEERHGGHGSAPSLIPSDALRRAQMRLVIRIHDIYLASPNAHVSQPVGLNVRS